MSKVLGSHLSTAKKKITTNNEKANFQDQTGRCMLTIPATLEVDFRTSIGSHPRGKISEIPISTNKPEVVFNTYEDT
jgi:hypothetical protein